MTTLSGFTLQDIFEAAGLAQLGASYADFEHDPLGTLQRCGQADALTMMSAGLRPLLPVQVRLRQQWQAQWQAEGSWDATLANLPLLPCRQEAPSRWQHAWQRLTNKLRATSSPVGRDSSRLILSAKRVGLKPDLPQPTCRGRMTPLQAPTTHAALAPIRPAP